jgi:phage terminase large subunit GpA-like protein
MAEVAEVLARARRALIPPPRLSLPDWIEAHIRLPDALAAAPGPVRLWPFQRGIAEAIGDPGLERVTVVKPVRVGFTTLLTAALAGYVANDPAPILCLLPAEADCRDYVVSDLEPTFAASPVVARALAEEGQEGERNTILSRRFPGGSLKIVAARAPRNLRRHTARVLFIDEADAMEATAEGSPILLAERRTLSFPNRKIVLGSTPVHEDTSHVLRAYAASDRRVFEVPCPACGGFAEILWEHIRWPEGRPEEAAWCCPACGVLTGEDAKPQMVAAGRWRATAPEVRGHAGFRLNALVSLHANASRGRLAAEFLAAKDDPATLQTFVNTILGQGWRGAGEELEETDLAARAEPWGLEAGLPPEALALTAGIDVQHDRLEATFLAWTEGGVPLAAGHRVIWGRYDDAATWHELDGLLSATWPHALGGRIALDAACIDAGDGATMAEVMRFAAPRLRRRLFPIKGAPGLSRPIIDKAGSKTKGGRLFIVGADAGKAWLFARLARPGAFRFSAELPEVWYEQAASERAVVRYRRGQPVRTFERIPGRRAEALDCLVYALAARQMVAPDWQARRAALAGSPAAPGRPRVETQSAWMNRR